MSIVASYDWESDTFTQYASDEHQHEMWRQAVQDIADKAKATLPDCAGRVDSAVKIVLAGDVELMPEGKARVRSQSNGAAKYFLVNGECTCPDYPKAPSNWCKHRLAYGIARRARSRVEAPQEAPEPQEADTRSTQGIPEVLKSYISYLHGKPFVRYAGLLALAHERGLVQLTAKIEFHAETLVLASATATFSDGRSFTEWADAMPSNVGAQVRPHWVRMALTRAKARALRDALSIGIAALEELSDTE